MTGSSPDAPPTGAETFGPYRLDVRLGRGGMGEVHRAYDTRRDRYVALKRLTPELAEDAETRERFERECRVAARLGSPHVIPIHDFGVIDGRLFLDMRLVEGRDLGRLLREEGPLDPARAVSICAQLANALDAAHDDGLVHRDVKPSNALVTTHRGEDFVYLVDFGIVRLLQGATNHHLTEAGSALGTLAYMSPEQIEGTEVDRRSDVYALAVVLFETLTGRPPFTGEMAVMLHQHLTKIPPTPSSLRPGIDPALDEVTLRGLAKAPGQRFAGTGELAEAARAALGGVAPAPSRPDLAAPSPWHAQTPQHGQVTAFGPSGPVGPVSPPGSAGWSQPLAPWGSPGPWGPQGPVDRVVPPAGPAWSPHAPGDGRSRRRGRVALVVGAAVLVVVLALVGLVVLADGDSAQPTIALGTAPVPLAAVFPDTLAGGCSRTQPSGNGDNVTDSGVPAEEIQACNRGPAAVSYSRWPTVTDATAYLGRYRSTPSADGQTTWSAGGAVQGPYVAVLTSGQCLILAGYTDLPYLIQVYATEAGCATTRATFDGLRPPGQDDLRRTEAVFAAARAPGCEPVAPVAGSSGVTPRETRRCPLADRAAVSYTRWNRPGEPTAEANTRLAGADGPTSWSATTGEREGPYARTEDADGTCHVLLGWDAAAYAAEVVAPDCDAADRAAGALAPPARADLPST